MARDQPDTVTTNEAVEAWRDDRTDLSTAELSALTREGQVLYDLSLDFYMQVVEEANEDQQDVVLVDGRDVRFEYRLDRLRGYLSDGTIEPIPREVVENAAGIAREIASYELGELDTLSRDDEYSVVEHTETLADAKNAVQLAGISRFEEGDGE